jgi:putative membrane protein insertion efficiency factor
VAVSGRGTSPLARVLLLAVRGWQVVPTMGPPRCRFAPSCSSYAVEAIQRHGGLRGGWLAARRVARCHPFHPGGIDRVPDLPRRRGRMSSHDHEGSPYV